MQNVINGIRLLLLIALGLGFLSGQGFLVIGTVFSSNFSNKRIDTSLLQAIPILIISGLVTNYGIVLLLHSLKVGLIVSGILATLGIAYFLFLLLRHNHQPIISLAPMGKWAGVACICMLFLGPILVIPLTDWDARSIWFFHAKMIYTAGSINQYTGWQDPSVAFSHAEYPNLVPTLAAQVAYLMGFWNEYLPKISLFMVLIPAVAWIFTFARRTFSFVVLLVSLLFSFYPFIWNGYMDGYFALYFSLALLLLGRYFKTFQMIDLLSSVYCLIMLLYLKNEGYLGAIVGVCVILLVLFSNIHTFSVRNLFVNYWKSLIVLIIMLIPLGLWITYKRQWGLSNDLEVGSAKSFLQIITRLRDGSLRIILNDTLVQLEVALILVGLTYFALIAWKQSLPRESIPAMIAAAMYCLGLIAIYLMTPFDLFWHLGTSIDRTMLPVVGCLLISAFFILDSLEEIANL